MNSLSGNCLLSQIFALSHSHSCSYFPRGLCNTVSLSDQLSDICIKPPNTWKTSVSNSVNKARHKKRIKKYIVNVWFAAPPMKLCRQFHYFNLPGTHSSLFLWLEVKNPHSFRKNYPQTDATYHCRVINILAKPTHLVFLENGQREMHLRQTNDQKDYFKQKGLHLRLKKSSQNNEINIISNNIS